ncbi:FAD-dependent oxidoreductase [Actinocorallia aurantiaca]|uniref:FAD-dependent oxidoreductase n=1 Tax=Actinocorallia aurantiaca TaxID=46204 RepID=A0ABN3U4Q7_9ACTN
MLVAGAGVGGLALARGLAADGHHVRVFEKADGPRTSGGVLTLWSNGAGILAELGVSLDGEGAPVDALVQYAFDGRRLLRMDAASAVRRYGRQHVCLPRRRLIRLLTDGLPDGAVSFGRACTGLAYDEGGVRLDFADGSSETGDVLVGADGHRSAVRRALWGQNPGGSDRTPQFIAVEDTEDSVVRTLSEQLSRSGDPGEPSGWATWQGLGRVPLGLAERREGMLIVGREGVCGLMPAGKDLVQWWFDRRWTPGDPLPELPVHDLRRRFGHWASPVPEVLAAIDGEVEFFPHYRHRVPRVWGRGPCTLVGDAAHTMPPTQAQGANQALEDAWALISALREATDLPVALRRYERERSRRAARIALAAGTECVNRYLPVLSRLVPDRLTGPAYTWWLRHISDYLSDLPR